MADPIRGRLLVFASLLVILILSVGLAILARAGSSPAVLYGRPLIVALACLLVWQGRLWARWLLLLFGLGILLAGPIAVGNNLSPSTRGGALSWIASFLYAASLLVLFVAPDARAYLATAAAIQGSARST